MWRTLLLLVVFAACSKLIGLGDVTYEGGDAAMPQASCGGQSCPEGYHCAPDNLTCIQSKVASSCAELGVDAIDQDVQLYLDGDATKPYSAHCTADLKTYLPLGGSNLSSYPLGSCGKPAPGATAGVTTTWRMVRFDTAMHAIDTGDYTFATSTGGTHEDSGDSMYMWTYDYLQVPFGNGRSCMSAPAQTVATIDLTGTHFALAPSQTWTAYGFAATAQAAINPQRTKATITAAGFPVGASTCVGLAYYYTTNGGTCIQLEYAP